MMLGLSLEAFTLLHVVISLIGIATGFVAIATMLRSATPGATTAIFLLTTILTSVTGFMFRSGGFTPAQAFGAISLVLLAIAVGALYAFRLAGPWRWIYVVTAIAAQYLNCFVLIVQAFQKVPALNAFAPTGTEPPFAAAQGVLLVLFVWLGWRGVGRFRPPAAVRL